MAAAALLDNTDKHIGRTYQLTGPESLSAAEELDILSHRLGRSLRLIEPPLESVKAGMAKHGFSGAVLDAIMARTLSDAGSTPLPAARQLLGRAPYRFADWVDRHIARFTK